MASSVSSESILVSDQAGRDVVFDVPENQFLKALHQDGGESNMVVVIKYRNDGGCFVST